MNEQDRDEQVSSSNEVLVDDNPYWGGPTCHSLVDFLSQIEKGFFSRPFEHSLDTNTPHTFNDIILFNNENYLVLNKPADVRMDGPYAVTVLRLLLYKYPPPSLSMYQDNPTLFLEKISLAHKHCDVSDFCLRASHQLDYATSGVLLFAKSRQAAAMACKAFQNRTTVKEYVALVHGHVSFHIHDIPCLPLSSLQGWQQGIIESEFRNHRQQRNGKRSCRHVPNSVVFDQWKSQQKSQMHHPNKRKKSTNDSPNRLMELIQTMDCLPEIPMDQIIIMTWSEVKDSYPKAQEYFDLLTLEYNKVLQAQDESNKQKQKEIDKVTHLPSFFRIEGEDENSFYIHLSLAEIPNQFEVQADLTSIPKSFLRKKDNAELAQQQPMQETSNTSNVLYRPALTRCIILKKGEFQGLPITKVCLQPRTGRRHQLRVHLASCGHPILGDATYEKDMAGAGDPNKPNVRTTKSRMCLHAHKLNIPLTEGQRFEFVAPDPF